MGFFGKISNGIKQFGKTVTNPSFFNKVASGVSNANNVVQKVGNFLKPIALMAGQPELVAGIDAVQGASGNIANGLEKVRGGNLSGIANGISNLSSVGGGSAPSVSTDDNNAINDAIQFA